MKPDIHKLNHFIIRVARIHMGHKELSGSSMDYRKAGLALIEQGIRYLIFHGSGFDSLGYFGIGGGLLSAPGSAHH